MRVVESASYSERRNAIAYEYIDFFEELGYTVILVPNNTKKLAEYLNNISEYVMIVISGGNNIYTTKYSVDDIYTERDELEYKVIESAIEKNMPLFGICRGFQIINLYFGSKLTILLSKEHVDTTHVLESKVDILDKEIVNSYHNFVVKENDLSDKLACYAKTGGVVEAIKHIKYNILGVQWHPERQSKNIDSKLIEKLIKGEL